MADEGRKQGRYTLKKNRSALSDGKIGKQPLFQHLIHHPLEGCQHHQKKHYYRINDERRAVIHSTMQSVIKTKQI